VTRRHSLNLPRIALLGLLTLAVLALVAMTGRSADAMRRVETRIAPRTNPAPAQAAQPVAAATPALTPQASSSATPSQLPVPATPRTTTALQADLNAVVAASHATVSISLVELTGDQPQTWSLNGDQQFVAASTYKLPLLMDEAQALAAGRVSANDLLCYTGDDWEDGWFGDYAEGACYSRVELMGRVGQFSDNTAAHILVRYLGGTDALNAYARAEGARASSFYDPNLTTANDLAALLAVEARGAAGGSAAEQVLYPLLTHTSFEAGIPAGIPANVPVVHKIGEIDAVVNDAALVPAPRGAYVLVVSTNGLGGDAGFKLIAAISQRVWAFESTA
jgi:beta-lactamase class A